MRIASVRVPGIERALSFCVHEENDRFISEQIVSEGIWEPFETELIRRFLTDDAGSKLFVDCGANIGWYSVVAGVLGAEVVACEPFPDNVALLRANIARNGLEHRVNVHEVALGAGSTAGVLRLSDFNQGDHRTVPDGVAADPSARTEISVQMCRLHDVLAGRTATVVKLDTQGSEVAIMRGGRTAWASPDSVTVLEFWPYGLDRCGSSVDALLELLGEIVGVTHECFEIIEWRKTLVPLTMADLQLMALTGNYTVEKKGHTNIVLIPQSMVEVVADVVGEALVL